MTTTYTEDGLIILPPGVLIPIDHEHKKFFVSFSTIQERKEHDFFGDCINELNNVFGINQFFNFTNDEE